MDYIVETQYDYGSLEVDVKSSLVVNNIDELVELIETKLISKDDKIEFLRHSLKDDEPYFFSIIKEDFEGNLTLEINGNQVSIEKYSFERYTNLTEQECCEEINKWFCKNMTNHKKYSKHFKSED